MSSAATNTQQQPTPFPSATSETSDRSAPNTQHDPQLFQPHYFFFYGSLCDPSSLAKVLNRQDKPPTRPGMIMEHGMRMWGEFPALLDGCPEKPIYGVGYKVRSPEEENRLAEYETDMYRKKGCVIEFRDGSKVPGVTFVWNADPWLLKEEGFDMKDWLLEQTESRGEGEVGI
ncbi:hypothetical protein BO83DRAFT_84451 [Aspergillus eucalypticola CBS 122712]|uniref:Putative gamma-glutamylcyclotransferase n=1 Tax=Aspergillus eucalypticola (strain CBS 122712 / IBT 29274) TaxID=1448314 RepID=A0A317WCV5_ASPEC|nr:uncharacterized protein BO83DRAFT_84451 [Aspergillus eucalypticola CBS 122712]PWY84284.1 hypothetical protein BO83DRAFT_84451 [Aspergillus eucalypticola CBS 122712]